MGLNLESIGRLLKPRRANTAEMRAIEFGEYLAKAAENYQACSNKVVDTDCCDGMEDLSEAYGALSSAIYEFRKRAMRAVIPT